MRWLQLAVLGLASGAGACRSKPADSAESVPTKPAVNTSEDAQEGEQAEQEAEPERVPESVTGEDAASKWPEYDCEADPDDADDALDEEMPDTEGETAWLDRLDAQLDGDSEASEETPSRPGRGVGALVWATGVSVDGEVFADGVQCSAFPGWAVTSPDRADEPNELMVAGERVSVIGEVGVRRVRVAVDAAAQEATVPSPTAGSPTIADAKSFELVVRRAKPSRKAKLIDERLVPSGPEGAIAKAWIEAEETVEYEAAGTLRGRFGDGVDTLVVVSPASIFRPSDPPELDYCTSEFVVAMRGSEVQGVLPLTRDAGQKSRRACACDEDSQLSVDNVEVARVVDLDGNGTQEIVWVYQYLGGDLTTQVSISYWTDGAFANVRRASCSYNGCERFLGTKACGRSLVKRYDTSKGAPRK